MLTLILIAGCIVVAMAQLQSFEFENTLSENQTEFIALRSNASGSKTLRLEDSNKKNTVQFSICAQPIDVSQPVRIYVDEIRYSNDGDSDYVYLKMDTVEVGVLQTVAKWSGGAGWNVFINSDQVGTHLLLGPGGYTLQIKVVTDKFGIELDTISINAENQNQTQELICGSAFLEQ